MSTTLHLECAACGKQHDATVLQGLCTACGKPLLVRYLLDAKAAIGSDSTMWRYRAWLPCERPLTLGEGWTPLLNAERLAKAVGLNRLFVKDESLNPTGSFKARGLSAAVSRAVELGARALVVPSAGNAAGAMSAYAALAGVEAHVFMPKDVPAPFRVECEVLGAKVTLVDGLITDCGRIAREQAKQHGWFDVSTLKEPYRVEGKKTLAYEIYEQLDPSYFNGVWIYPTGGGTGIVGMWKALQEMESMGWIGKARPRFVAVQPTGCQPIVRAFNEGLDHAPAWEGAHTVADGLRVPAAIGDFLILQALRDSHGTAIAVEDAELLQGARDLARFTGIFPSPEGGATFAALRRLLDQGWIKPEDPVVLFNTGGGLKYYRAFNGGA